MAGEPPPASGPPSGFSTGFWKEFSLRHSRPAVYVAVLAAYGAFALVLFATASSPDHVWVRWLALGLLTAAVNVTAAVHAARRAPGAKDRAAIRRLLGEAGPFRHDRWYRAEVLRSMGAPAMAVLFLTPLYFVPGLTGVSPDVEQLIVGALMWLQAVTSAAAAAAAGGWVAQRRSPRRPRSPAVAAFLLATVLARSPLTFVAGLFAASFFWDHLDKSLHAYYLARAFLTADILACLLAWFALVRAGTNRFSEALLAPESEPELKDLAREDPESLGLDVSFWALFRWKLFRDPLFRAERRGFWTWRRLVILWGGFATAQVAGVLLFWGNWGLSHMVVSGRAGHLVLDIVQHLPLLAAATLVAVSMATDRQTGALESMIITPVAPLRLAASRLAGKCSHPILALIGLTAPMYFFQEWVSQQGGWRMRIDLAIVATGYFGMTACVVSVLAVSACGAVGLYFAARWRSLVLTLPVTYGFLIAFSFALNALIRWFWTSLYDGWREEVSFDPMPAMVISGLAVLAYGVLLRIFLVAAARQLAIRGNE